MALATSSKVGFQFLHLKDLLHTAKCKDVLLDEQTKLQKNTSEWLKKCEDCQKKGETKQQQLQELQNEIEGNKVQLAQQEMVLHINGFTSKGVLCLLCELSSCRKLLKSVPHGTGFP